MSEEGKKTHTFRQGLVIGVVAGAVLLLVNKKSRNKITSCVTDCKDTTKRWITVVKENQDSFLKQLKASSEKIATIVEDASEDIEKLVESSQHVKEYTFEIIKTIKEAKEDFQTLSKKLKGEDDLQVD